MDVSPSQDYTQHYFVGSHLYNWVKRGTMRVVSCPRTGTMNPARARTRAARSGVQRANHKATASFISPITLAWGDYEYVCTSFPWMGSYSFARLPTSIKFVVAYLYTWLEKASAYTDGSFGWSTAACSRTQHNIRLVLEQGLSLRSLEH